jgi:hypothetical protein
MVTDYEYANGLLIGQPIQDGEWESMDKAAPNLTGNRSIEMRVRHDPIQRSMDLHAEFLSKPGLLLFVVVYSGVEVGDCLRVKL